MQKVCVVTGGSAGIGLAVVERFLNDGYTVYNLDIQAGASGEFIACDVTDQQQIITAIEQVLKQSQRIDVVVSNAGIHYSGTIEQTSIEDFERVMSINVKGAYYLLQAVLPTMKAQGSGAVVLIGSDQSVIGKPNSFAYNLSKAALASMAKTTALDYARHGIRANAVCPGTIETPLYHKAIDAYCVKSGADKAEVHKEEGALQPLGRIGQPQEVAALVAFIASDEAAFITGSLQMVDGGYTTQ